MGSSSLELSENAVTISYEEYHPYGTTSFSASNAAIKSAAKRYRYTGMERDEESGMSYHCARYYLNWLGRWLSADPIGIEGGSNLFQYSKSQPCNFSDKKGTETDEEMAEMFTGDVEMPIENTGAGSGVLIDEAVTPELMNTWSYSNPVPNRSSLGANVQRDHPIQVSTRVSQRTGPSGQQYYSRSISAAEGELTILAETGKGYFHTVVGGFQADIRRAVLLGKITTEAELIEATQRAYHTAALITGTEVNETALAKAILSNQSVLHSTSNTGLELRLELGVDSSDFPTDANIDAAFHDIPDSGSDITKADAPVVAPNPKPSLMNKIVSRKVFKVVGEGAGVLGIASAKDEGEAGWEVLQWAIPPVGAGVTGAKVGFAFHETTRDTSMAAGDWTYDLVRPILGHKAAKVSGAFNASGAALVNLTITAATGRTIEQWRKYFP